MELSGEAFLRAHVDYTGDDCVIWPLAKKGGGRGRALYGAVKIGRTQKSAHGITPAPVGMIKRRETWKHVQD